MTMWTLIYIIIILQQTRIFVAGGCGGYYTSMTGSFTSENYPLPYLDNSRCRYTIMVPEGYSITLTFIHFDLEATHDSVLVKENVLQLFYASGKRENISPINSSGNSLYVYFRSDVSVTHSGFSATYYTNSVVNGGWSSWLNWTSCTVSCGGGISTRSRDCINPAPSGGGTRCLGDSVESRVCNRNCCPVNGGWSSWLNWTSCTISCGGGISTRSRDCINPAPSGGGTRCFGDPVESRVCNRNCCPVNGNWSTWSIWDNCDVTCGFGIKQRTRTCNNPYPVFGGFSCTGKDLQTQNCSTSPCPVNGGWSSWLNWNSCTVSCGGGISTRSRDCINPAPSNGGTPCFSDSAESRVCNRNCCPVNGNWSAWSIWDNCDVTCGFGIHQRIRACDNPYPVFDGSNCTGKDLQTQNCSSSPCPVLIDSHKPLYSSGVVGGIAVACIICTSVLCLIVHLTIRRLRQNKGREETRLDINERDTNYEELRLRRATQSYENAEYNRPDNPQGDVRGNAERPESNVDEHYEEFRLRRATQSFDNAEYIRPDNPQGDVCGNTERPESNAYENFKY